MTCYKCKKDMAGKGTPSIEGMRVNLKVKEPWGLGLERDAERVQRINYNNRQLGKYSDGSGGCHIAVCMECYIDAILDGKGANYGMPEVSG